VRSHCFMQSRTTGGALTSSRAEVALSRSALAERFAALVGEPPMQYLMRWRLALAAQMLRSGTDPVARIAERSGYDSGAAFSRAFRREFGVPPGAWRKAAPLRDAEARAT
jgi:AraC-like DNA-binding protein